MSKSLDLNVFALARSAGQTYPELMSFHVAEAPRRSARGRNLDRLILYMVMIGNAPLSPGKQEQALEHLAKIYYQTPGSVTAAMRVLGEELNRLLLTRNQRIANIGQQGMSWLIQAVLKGEQLFLAHSGPMHSYVITAQDNYHFFDGEMGERSLGQSRQAPLRLFQAQIHPTDTLILAALPSEEWAPSVLSSIHGQGPESMRRRLFNEKMGDVNALLIQARPGQGKFFVGGAKDYSRKDTPKDEMDMVELATAQQTSPVQSVSPTPSEPTPTEREVLVEQEVHAFAVETSLPQIEAEGYPPSVEQAEPQAAAQQEAGAKVPKGSPSATLILTRLWKGLLLVGTPVANLLKRFWRVGRTAINRVIPEEMIQSVPSSALMFLAIAVPLIVVAVASRAYLSLGQEAQDEALYAQAEQMVLQAMSETDLFKKRATLEAALQLLVEAGESNQVEQVRVEARDALDNIDLIQRVDYQTAIIGGLPNGVQVTRLVSSGTDLFMLDGNSGNVLRAKETSQGFALDTSFQCGPGASSVLLVGPVIDIVAWPAGYEPKASLLAMDANGYLLYCEADEPAKAAKLTAPLNGAFNDLKGIAADLGDLYILDPLSNAVWIFRGSDPSKEPFLFFDSEVPKLSDVVDLTVNNNELYLLHEDGLLTLCVYSGYEEVPNRCTDLPYVDFRPGRENTPLVFANPIEQVQYTPPPDPSLHVLEAASQSIYHFSLRNLAFQRQYMPLRSLATGKATAFAVNNLRRYLFLALGNNIYYSAIP